MRDLSSLKPLHSVEEVVACMSEDPSSRVLLYSYIGENYWGIWVVCSSDGLNLDLFVDRDRRRGHTSTVYPDEIAFIVRPEAGYSADMEKLLDDAEMLVPGRLLSGTRYEDLLVHVNHPEAASLSDVDFETP